MDDSNHRRGGFFFGGEKNNDEFGIFRGGVHDAFDLFQPFRSIMQSFFTDIPQDMFPPSAFGSVGPDGQEPDNARDRMLKQPDNSQTPQHWFDDVFARPALPAPYSRQGTEDTDLDDTVSSYGLPSALPERNVSSFFSSSFSRTIRSANGKIEEERTVRDSSGKEEKTVRRVLGDQSHTVTTKKHSDGGEEVVEDFVNMDEGSLTDFNKNWHSNRHTPQLYAPQTEVEVYSQPGPKSGGFMDVFRRFFGR